MCSILLHIIHSAAIDTQTRRIDRQQMQELLCGERCPTSCQTKMPALLHKALQRVQIALGNPLCRTVERSIENR